MNKKKISAILAAVILMTGCSKNGGTVSDMSVPDNSVNDMSVPEMSAPEVSTTESGTTKETPNNVSGMPEEISNYLSSLDNGDFVFVDYTFNDSPDVITDPSALGGAYDRALAALKETDGYAEFIDGFSDAEQFGRFVTSHEEYLNGVPVFKRALTDDFDRDGDDESLIMIGMPVMPEGEERWHEREFLFLADEDGAALLDDYYNAEFTATLDYGSTKQVIVSSEGWNGSDSVSNIWRINGGEASTLYGGRLTYQKNGCFLYSSGPQGIGDLAVYDLDKGEYLAIRGKPLDTDDVLAMGDLPEEYRERLKDGWSVTLLGGKFYIISDGNFEGTRFTYENGKFAESSEQVRISCTPGLTGNALGTLDDVDYDAALRAMKSPTAFDTSGERTTK